jgi:hypothetical protein
VVAAAHTACQSGVCCHTNYLTKLPKFVHRNYASLVNNIDVGILLQIIQQKTAKRPKTMKKHLTWAGGIFFENSIIKFSWFNSIICASPPSLLTQLINKVGFG